MACLSGFRDDIPRLNSIFYGGNSILDVEVAWRMGNIVQRVVPVMEVKLLDILDSSDGNEVHKDMVRGPSTASKASSARGMV